MSFENKVGLADYCLESPGKNHADLISSFDMGFQFYSQQYEVVHIGRLIGHEGSIFRIACSSDGSMLISVSDDCRCAS